MSLTQDNQHSTNRTWLGEFLRSRRERLSPKDYGFPVLKRRRSPGLLREEVAQLSGISAAYYTWLEQGRDINMSSEVLNAVARALRLTEAERVHLFTLVGKELRENPTADEALHPTIAHIFNDHSAGLAAYLCDSWFNVLEATRLATSIFGIGAGPDLDSNLLHRLFADPRQRSLWVDWQTEAHIAVGMFRQGLAKQPTSAEGMRLLESIQKTPDFESVWEAYDVRVRPSPDEFFRREPWAIVHPDVGLLRVHRVAMAIPARAERTLVLYSPADAETSCKFRSLQDPRVPRAGLYLVPA